MTKESNLDNGEPLKPPDQSLQEELKELRRKVGCQETIIRNQERIIFQLNRQILDNSSSRLVGATRSYVGSKF